MAQQQTNAGWFKKGEDSRRWTQGPRPRKSFEDMVREHTETALNALVECVEDKGAHWRERREAPLALLAHGHGTPVQRHLLAEVNASNSKPESLGLNDLIRLVQQDDAPELHQIEGEYEEVSRLDSDVDG